MGLSRDQCKKLASQSEEHEIDMRTGMKFINALTGKDNIVITDGQHTLTLPKRNARMWD